MLAKDPASRYASAHELLRELRVVRTDLNGDGDFDDIDDGLSQSETPVAGRSRATHRLDTLMRTTAVRRAKRNRIGLWILAALASFGLGAIGAWSARSPSLLEQSAPEEPRVEEQETARAQVLLASLLRSEDGWKAVLKHWGHDAYSANEARRELGLLYLHRSDERQALEQFDSLASQRDDTQVEFRAVGLAGQAVVLSLQGKHGESNRKLAELVPIMDKLNDQRMQQWVREAIEENSRALSNQDSEQLKELFRERWSE
jgi:hypothetical protein